MYKFSKRSLERLESCHVDLQDICKELIKHMDITVLEGYRSKEKQNKAFSEGKSKLQFPNSKHNKTPSMAVDIAPYPIDWDDRERFAYMGGLAKGIAAAKGIKLRWGADWNSDGNIKDHSFQDMPHIELEG